MFANAKFGLIPKASRTDDITNKETHPWITLYIARTMAVSEEVPPRGFNILVALLDACFKNSLANTVNA